MKTKIAVWSTDETLAVGKQVILTEFITQAEAYFNQFGHLPTVGSIIKQDKGSPDSGVVVYVTGYEYSGIQSDRL